MSKRKGQPVGVDSAVYGPIKEAVCAHDYAAFEAAERDVQNAVLDSLRKSGELLQIIAEGFDQIPFDKPLQVLASYGAYQSLQHAHKRQDWYLFRPLARRILCELASLEPAEQDPPLADLLDEYGLGGKVDPLDTNAVTKAITKETIASGGPGSWQEVLALSYLSSELVIRDDASMPAERPLRVALEHMLGSRRLLKAVQIWDEVWTRIPLIDSDMYYHDSRLRRALLDRNIDHAFRLIAASIKSGLSADEVVGHFIKAMYDIDFADPMQMVLIPFGLQAICEQEWDARSKEFQHAMARMAYDVMFFERTPKERLQYDQISLLKSREILIDFRKGFLQSVFLQAWGIAEYAFVHGFEPVEILDEVYRVSASLGDTMETNLLSLYHLWSVSELIDRLDEEYSLYLLAFAIRHLVRQPKMRNLLDPFPDEME